MPTDKRITPEAMVTQMKRIADIWEDDPEKGHSDADDLLVKVLRSLGYGTALDIYEEHTRWMA